LAVFSFIKTRKNELCPVFIEFFSKIANEKKRVKMSKIEIKRDINKKVVIFKKSF
jgi:hypothetical protein